MLKSVASHASHISLTPLTARFHASLAETHDKGSEENTLRRVHLNADTIFEKTYHPS